MESLTFVGYFQPSKTDIICSFAFKLLNLDNITKNKLQSVKKIFAKNINVGILVGDYTLFFVPIPIWLSHYIISQM